MQPLRLALLQFSPTLRDLSGNARHVARAAQSDCDLLLTPELSLTGYGVADDAAALAVPIEEGERLPTPLGETFDELPVLLIVGLLEAQPAGGSPYNAAVLLDRGFIRHKHRKLYLPSYGMFDEARFFARGSSIRACDLPGGWRAGVLVCEDFWHPALSYVLATAGIHLLLVLAAAPGRGVLDGHPDGGPFASSGVWERIARTTAQLYGIYVALANRTGVEGGITFAGGSIVADPSGDVIGRAGPFEEELLQVELRPDALAAARQPYAHARDDDPHLTLRLLRAVLAQ